MLYPAPRRDLFMRLALADLFRARWTEQIHEEWMRNVLAAIWQRPVRALSVAWPTMAMTRQEKNHDQRDRGKRSGQALR